MKERFPGLGNGWSRFDGPAGTQVVDTAIEAMSAWQRSGNNANSHGAFAAAHACDALMAQARQTMSRLLGGDEQGWVFGPSTTNNVMQLTRAVAQGLEPGDQIICTTLDHDSNVWPWHLAARDAGAEVKMAGFDVATGRLCVEAVVDQITEQTSRIRSNGGPALTVYGPAGGETTLQADLTLIEASNCQGQAGIELSGVTGQFKCRPGIGACNGDVLSHGPLDLRGELVEQVFVSVRTDFPLQNLFCAGNRQKTYLTT